MIYECEKILGFEDVGKSNKMSNIAVIRAFENAAGMHSEKVNWGLNSIDRTGISWILLGWKVKIINRPKYNEKLLIKTWGRDSNKAFTYRDYELYDEANKLCAIATSKWAIIDVKKGKLAEITPEMIASYECESKKVFEDKSNLKLKEPKTVKSEITYKVQRRDIDVNNHVHNLYYLSYAYEALPQEIYEQGEYCNIEIMYKSQIKLSDEIKCLYTEEEGQNIITIKSIDNKVLHSIIKLY